MFRIKFIYFPGPFTLIFKASSSKGANFWYIFKTKYVQGQIILLSKRLLYLNDLLPFFVPTADPHTLNIPMRARRLGDK